MAESEIQQRFRFPGFGLYPLADSAAWVEQLVMAGVALVQLRLKSRPDADPELEIPAAVAAARGAGARLVVNGDWRLALAHGAQGVHLGLADWNAVDLAAVREAGLIVGVSVHNFAEIHQAFALQPDYLTLGTVFPTPSKDPGSPTLGRAGFEALRAQIPLPTAAIGGLGLENAGALLTAGADAVCVISDLRDHRDLATRVAEWRRLFARHGHRHLVAS